MVSLIERAAFPLRAAGVQEKWRDLEVGPAISLAILEQSPGEIPRNL